MKEQKSRKNELNQNKGITLIALVITIIVLLILAGVSISAITGNESTMEKAKEAKTATEKADELDAIKLAVISAMVNGTDGYVNGTNLADALEGIVSSDQITEIRANTSGPWEITGDKDTYTITANGRVITSPRIGDSVNYSTTLNGTTLNKWRVFYIDGDYTYIILDDYLPNAAVNIAEINTNGIYSVYTDSDRSHLVNAMTTKSNWDSLLTGTLNGNAVNETRTENVWAMGAPDLELWVNSWNASYPSDTVYTAQVASAQSDGLFGYYIGDVANPSTTYINLSSKTGYGNTLYYPHQEKLDSDRSYGYWLASPSAVSTSRLMYVNYGGDVTNNFSNNTFIAFRPVVRLPSSILK